MLFFTSACSLLPEQSDETTGWSASKLYLEAKKELANGIYYDKAIRYLEKLEARYPFSTYAQQAQINVAYAYYCLKDQFLALDAIDRFIKLHPNHINVDYMYYLRGLVNFNNQNVIFDFFTNQDHTERNLQTAHDSFIAFQMLTTRFPNSIYTPDAILRMKYLLNAMAQYNLHIARYYFRRHAYIAAVNRAQFTIKEYQNTLLFEEALYIMMRSYEALGQTKLFNDTKRLIQINYPNSIYLRHDKF